MVTEPTWITESSSSILDLFFTNNDTLVNQVRVLPGILDHEAVFIESSLRPMKKISSPRRVYKYHKADYDNFRKDFLKFSEEFVEQVSTMDIQTMWNKFKTTIHTLMEKHIPHKTIRGQNYSIFMRNFKQNQYKLSNNHVQFSNRNLLCKFEPPSRKSCIHPCFYHLFYFIYMGQPIWDPYGTRLHCPYGSHMGPIWDPYRLLAGLQRTGAG